MMRPFGHCNKYISIHAIHLKSDLNVTGAFILLGYNMLMDNGKENRKTIYSSKEASVCNNSP